MTFQLEQNQLLLNGFIKLKFMHGTIMKIKARLVVQGFYQCASEDFKKKCTHNQIQYSSRNDGSCKSQQLDQLSSNDVEITFEPIEKVYSN